MLTFIFKSEFFIKKIILFIVIFNMLKLIKNDKIAVTLQTILSLKVKKNTCI